MVFLNFLPQPPAYSIHDDSCPRDNRSFPATVIATRWEVEKVVSCKFVYKNFLWRFPVHAHTTCIKLPPFPSSLPLSKLLLLITSHPLQPPLQRRPNPSDGLSILMSHRFASSILYLLFVHVGDRSWEDECSHE